MAVRNVGGAAAAAGWMMAGPALAQDQALQLVPPAQRLRFIDLFADASLANRGLMLLLALAAGAAIVLWVVGRLRTMGSEPSRAVGGLRYLKGMWVGSLLLGLLGASFTVLSMCVGLANVRPTPSVAILAPGFAEALFQVTLGLLAAAVAVICHQDLDARLRRLAASV